MIFFCRKVQKERYLYSPMNGQITTMEKVPEEAFSQKMMGEGVAIVPKDGNVYAPCDGEIISIFPTKHAIVIAMKDGLEVMLHVGIHTVRMDGLGFQVHVTEGNKVVAGDLLLQVDLDLLAEKKMNPITPFLVLNLPKKAEFHILKYGEVVKGEPVMQVTIESAKVIY